MLDISDRLTTYEPLWENWYKDSFIGGGAFGKVYKLKQNFFGETRYSAVKILPIDLTNELSTMSNGKEQFIEQRKASVVQEIKNMYKLKGQKNLVQCIAHNIKDICDDNGNVVGFDVLIQMEYYVSLTNYMRDNGMLSPDQVEKLATDIATGLKAMHDINMLHRDIKPGNIFVDKNGDLALGDFGISKQEMRSSYSTIAGTHSFIAPEVWKIRDTNKRYTKTADIYSYGIVLYCLLNDNMLPLVNEGSNQNDIEAAIDARLAGQSFPPPKNGSDKLKSIVMKCCEYRPEDRFQSMSEVLSALNDQSFRISPKPAAAMQQDSFATVYAGDTFNNQSMGNNYQSPIQPQQQNQYGQPQQQNQYGQPQNFQQNNGYGTPFVYQQATPPMSPQPMQQYGQQNYGNQGSYAYNSFRQDTYEPPAAERSNRHIGAILATIVISTLVLIIMILLVFLKLFSKEKTTGDPELTTRTPVTVSVDSQQVPETTETGETTEETEESVETDATVSTLPERVQPESVEFSGYVYVLADLKYTGLIIRKGPSTDYGIEYDSIPRGGSAEKYAEALDKKKKEKWTYVRYVDDIGVEHYGWIYSAYVSDSPTLVIPDEPLGAGTTMRVATKKDPLNLRSGPSYDYKAFKEIPRGKTVTMFTSRYNDSEKRTFAYVCYDTYYGWVNMQYLADPDKPLPTETTTTKATTTKAKTTTKKKTTTKEPEDDSDGEYCGLPVASVKASSYLPSETTNGKNITYYPENVVDGKLKTAWVEDDPDDGIGEWIELELEQEEMISEIYIANGYQSSEKSFKLNNRVKKLRLDFSDGSSYEYTLSGKYSDQPEIIELPESVTTTSVRITILSVYSGTKYNDTCISEIEVY